MLKCLVRVYRSYMHCFLNGINEIVLIQNLYQLDFKNTFFMGPVEFEKLRVNLTQIFSNYSEFLVEFLFRQ